MQYIGAIPVCIWYLYLRCLCSMDITCIYLLQICRDAAQTQCSHIAACGNIIAYYIAVQNSMQQYVAADSSVQQNLALYSIKLYSSVQQCIDMHGFTLVLYILSGACISRPQLFFIITEKQIGVSISLHVGVLMCSCRLYYMQHATINLIQK